MGDTCLQCPFYGYANGRCHVYWLDVGRTAQLLIDVGNEWLQAPSLEYAYEVRENFLSADKEPRSVSC